MRSLTSLLALAVAAPLAVAAGSAGCGKSYVDAPVVWRSDVDTAIARARAEHKGVFVFFGASWDTAAKELETRTFVDPEVRALLTRSFVSVRVDMTDDEDPRTRAMQNRFKVVGDPTVVVLASDAMTELVRFNEYVPPPRMARALASASKEDLREAQYELAIQRREQEARWEEYRLRADLVPPVR
jgi:thiol:disulfide interchange protein